MPSRAEIKLLKICCWISGTLLNLLPMQIRFIQNRAQVSNRSLGPKITFFWQILVFVSLVSIMAELASNIYLVKINKIATIIYQLFVVFVRTATISFIYAFQTNAREISNLLNCLFQTNRRILFHTKKTDKEDRKGMVLASLFACVGVILFTYTIAVPTVVFALPCLYDSPLTKLVNWNCSSLPSRIMISLTELICMLPTSAAGIVVVPVILICLDETKNELQNLR